MLSTQVLQNYLPEYRKGEQKYHLADSISKAQCGSRVAAVWMVAVLIIAALHHLSIQYLAITKKGKVLWSELRISRADI